MTLTTNDEQFFRTLAELSAILDRSETRKSEKVKKKLAEMGLTEQESRDWITSEPDFVVPLKRPRDKLTEYPLGEGIAS